MTKEQLYKSSGIISVSLIAILFALVAFRLVPSSYYYPLFGLAIVIYIVRMILRSAHEKAKKRSQDPPEDKSGAIS